MTITARLNILVCNEDQRAHTRIQEAALESENNSSPLLDIDMTSYAKPESLQKPEVS